MFEGKFNLSFNLHKAYTDIGVKDDDRKKMACIYDLSDKELDDALKEFESFNSENAKSVLEKYPDFKVDPQKEFRLAFLGDSITSYRMSYRCIFNEIFSAYDNVVMKDFSISGLKVSDLFTAFYPGINDFGPNIATIMIGTNDMRITNDEYGYEHTPLDHFARDYEYLIKKLNDMGCTAVAITLPPFCMEKMEVALDGWKILYKEDVMKRYDDVIADIAVRNNAPLVDMRDEYKKYDPYDITIEDGLHLNPKGHGILAGCIFEKLGPLFK